MKYANDTTHFTSRSAYLRSLKDRYEQFYKTLDSQSAKLNTKYSLPVFINHNDNILLKSQHDTLQPIKLHPLFGSMNSSQALTLSVFGNLQRDKLSILKDLISDEKKPLFIPADMTDCKIEYELPYLQQKVGKPRNILGEETGHGTSIDVFFSGSSSIAVECKFTEEEIGTCSCCGKGEGCYLIQVGIRYWDYIQTLFKPTSSFQLTKEPSCDNCPIRDNYQLVRNILAVAIDEYGKTKSNPGHVVMLYDERNPAFYDAGKAMKAWQDTKDALKDHHMLQKCSWQELVTILNKDKELHWLTVKLKEKYGF